MARPTSLDDSVKARIVAAVEAGCGRRVAAQAAGVDRSTLLRWLASGRDGVEPFASLLREVQVAEARGEASCLDVIRAASARTWQAAAWLLERRHPERWARREPKPPAAPLRQRSVSDMSLEELAAIVDQERARRTYALPSFFAVVEADGTMTKMHRVNGDPAPTFTIVTLPPLDDE